MKLLIIVSVSAALATAACRAEPPQPSASEVFGAWKVTRINTVGTVTEGEQRMNALLGTTLIITKDQVLGAGAPPCAVVKPYPVANTVDTAKEVPPQAAPSPAAPGCRPGH